MWKNNIFCWELVGYLQRKEPYFCYGASKYVQLYILFITVAYLGLHMGPNKLCYVTCHFLFFSYVAMSLFIRP